VNLRHQYRTALAVGADLINQDLHIPCDEAIAKREKLFHTGFTVSSRWSDGQLRTVPLFKAVKAFFDMLEQAHVRCPGQSLKSVPILLDALQASREPGDGSEFIPSIIQLVGKALPVNPWAYRGQE
jgi:hypothetical protein